MHLRYVIVSAVAIASVMIGHVTGLECRSGQDDETPDSTIVCEKGEVCYGRTTESDYYTSSGKHLHSMTHSYGCEEAEDCAKDSGRNVESTGGGHFFTTNQYCCCTDLCASGDSDVNSGNFGNCPNARGDAASVNRVSFYLATFVMMVLLVIHR